MKSYLPVSHFTKMRNGLIAPKLKVAERCNSAAKCVCLRSITCARNMKKIIFHFIVRNMILVKKGWSVAHFGILHNELRSQSS